VISKPKQILQRNYTPKIIDDSNLTIINSSVYQILCLNFYTAVHFSLRRSLHQKKKLLRNCTSKISCFGTTKMEINHLIFNIHKISSFFISYNCYCIFLTTSLSHSFYIIKMTSTCLTRKRTYFVFVFVHVTNAIRKVHNSFGVRFNFSLSSIHSIRFFC
jgi:hypothetical protein